MKAEARVLYIASGYPGYSPLRETVLSIAN